jgi:hypothetical protein
MKKTIWERIKSIVEAIKAAKTLYTLILLLLAYTGYQEVNNVSTETVDSPETTLKVIEAVNPAKDCILVIKEEISKSNKRHSNRHHGGS